MTGAGMSEIGNCSWLETLVLCVILAGALFVGCACAIEAETGLPARVAVHQWVCRCS